MRAEVIIDLEALNEAVKYLAKRPYHEVANIIENLKATIREIPDDKKQTQKQATEKS